MPAPKTLVLREGEALYKIAQAADTDKNGKISINELRDQNPEFKKLLADLGIVQIGVSKHDDNTAEVSFQEKVPNEIIPQTKFTFRLTVTDLPPSPSHVEFIPGSTPMENNANNFKTR